MKFLSALLVFLMLFNFSLCSQNNEAKDRELLRKIYDEALMRGKCYEQLRFLSEEIGGRLSGSPQAAAAVEFLHGELKKMALDSVWLQPVMVPHWVRGNKEFCRVISPFTENLRICALGNSVGTLEGGISAMVVEVKSEAELEKLGRKNIEGKIVFFNKAMDACHISTFKAYGEAAWQRVWGASKAASYGAAAVIVRSLGLREDDYPHTGVMVYDEKSPKIPAAALSVRAAERLSKILKKHPEMTLELEMNCEMLPDVLSYNVIGEIKGSEFPEEIILVGGHIDAWDNGDGAHDDGAGCVHSTEVLRIFKDLALKPKRTVRCVLFMNEENGLRGGLKYAEEVKKKSEKHLAAIETDRGGFTPRGFDITETKDGQIKAMRSWLKVFSEFDIEKISAGGGGADIGPLLKLGVPTIGYVPDSQRYFDYHHTEIDKFEAVNKRELELGAAGIASLVWFLSEYGFQGY